MEELCAEELWCSLRGLSLKSAAAGQPGTTRPLDHQHHSRMHHLSLAPCSLAPVHKHTTTAPCLRTSASLPRDTRAVLPADDS